MFSGHVFRSSRKRININGGYAFIWKCRGSYNLVPGQYKQKWNTKGRFYQQYGYFLLCNRFIICHEKTTFTLYCFGLLRRFYLNVWHTIAKRHLLNIYHRWSLGMDKWFHPTPNCVCDYLSMFGLKLINVSKRAPGDNTGKAWVAWARVVNYGLGALLLTWNNFNFSMDERVNPLQLGLNPNHDKWCSI